MAKPKLTVVKSARSSVSAPAHLGDPGRELWTSIQTSYEISDPGGLCLLRTAAEAADRVASCREMLDEQGEVIMVKGVPRAHPAAAIERDARAALIRALKELHLDLEPLRDRPGRPPGGGLGWRGD
jgi:phage terminase small subunit